MLEFVEKLVELQNAQDLQFVELISPLGHSREQTPVFETPSKHSPTPRRASGLHSSKVASGSSPTPTPEIRRKDRSPAERLKRLAELKAIREKSGTPTPTPPGKGTPTPTPREHQTSRTPGRRPVDVEKRVIQVTTPSSRSGNRLRVDDMFRKMEQNAVGQPGPSKPRNQTPIPNVEEDSPGNASKKSPRRSPRKKPSSSKTPVPPRTRRSQTSKSSYKGKGKERAD